MEHYARVEDQLHTVRDFLRWGLSRFNEQQLWYGHGTDNAWDEVLALVMHGLHLSPEGDDRFLDARLTREEKTRVLGLLTRRIDERIPAPYLTGTAWFAGLPFRVDQRVLIPRSPFAELIENGFSPWLTQSPARILDLCTGSGCIGIACAYAFADAEVVLSDISVDALAVAEENIALHQLDGRVAVVESDLFEAMPGARFDLIVSNPPYVDEEDYRRMPAEYSHEPELALVSGSDGLDFTRRLLRQAVDHLSDDGLLVAEVGNSRPALEEAFPEVPFIWLELERGGDGIFAIARHELVACNQFLVK